MRKRLAACCLPALTAGIVACTGTSTAAPTSGASASGTPGMSAAAVATNYYRTIAARNYRRAFTYLSARTAGPDGRRLTLRAFLQLARMLDGGEGPVTQFSVGAFHSLVVMTVSRQRAGPYHTHLRMARNGNGWTITSIDRI